MRTTTTALFAALALAGCGSGGGGAKQQQGTVDGIGTNPQGCSRFFPAGKQPVMGDRRYAPKTRTLCRRAYAVMHSGLARQPLWVAEAITREQVKLGTEVPRLDSFRPDPEVPASERAELSDYRGSGYDRGHMAPDADMPTAAASSESFLLSNISPQAGRLNRNSWKDLEVSVRRQTRGGTVFVLTGPLFQADKITTTRKDGRLLVPTHFFKAIYAEARGATVFVATNSDTPQWTTMTVDQFRTVYGIDAFPGMRSEFRNVNGVLDGSLNRVASGTKGAKAKNAGKNGAATADPSDPTSPAYVPRRATCRRVGDRTVQDPVTGEAITRQQYAVKFRRNSKAIERCPS